MFCHEKIWWNNSEIFIDEMFVHPDLQQKGYGSELINVAEEYVKEHKLAGFTLSTNRYAPAPQFYKKNGFVYERRDYSRLFLLHKIKWYSSYPRCHQITPCKAGIYCLEIKIEMGGVLCYNKSIYH